MKKLIILLLVLCLSGCSSSWERIFVDLTSSNKVQAVWLSFVDYQEMLRGKTESEFQENVQTMMTNLESIGMNYIYAHASFYTDAIYESEYYPWSSVASGKIGKALDYDPLAILLNEAELRKIKVEAWINPLRSFTKKEMEQVPDQYPVKQWYLDKELRAKNLMLVDGRYYLNPGSDDVVELVQNVVKELCEKYSFRGIHIDDYFYPAGIRASHDELTYLSYLETHPEVSLADYRRSMSDRLVSGMYDTIKRTNHSMTFSISPSANIDSNYNDLYADVRKWANESGYCDVMIPQIYFGFENSNMPFEEVVQQWEDIIGKHVRLVYGLAAYKVGEEDKYAGEGRTEWIQNVDILSRQVQFLKRQKRYDGVAFFRYYSMFYPKSDVKQQMKIELSKLKDELK